MTRTIDEILHDVRIRALDLRHPCTVAPGATLGEVEQLLVEGRCRGAVLVVEEGRPVGIFTERDVLYRTALNDVDRTTPIGELATSPVKTAGADDLVADAVETMTRGGYRHLPLVDRDGRAVGILAGRDLLRFIAGHFPEAVLNLPPKLHQVLMRPEGG